MLCRVLRENIARVYLARDGRQRAAEVSRPRSIVARRALLAAPQLRQQEEKPEQGEGGVAEPVQRHVAQAGRLVSDRCFKFKHKTLQRKTFRHKTLTREKLSLFSNVLFRRAVLSVSR